MAIIPGEKKSVSLDLPQDSKQKQKLYWVVLILVITVGVLYFGFRKPDLSSSASPAPKAEAIDTNAYENLNKVDFARINSFLKGKNFQNLKVYGENPPAVGVKGRQDPFAPF